MTYYCGEGKGQSATVTGRYFYVHFLIFLIFLIFLFALLGGSVITTTLPPEG